MDFDLPADDDPRRAAVRRWASEHPQPTGREMAEAGYVAPHWPAPWGLDADPVHQLIIDDELKRAGLRRPSNQIGIGWAGPTLLHAGTDAQKERYLFPLLAGEEIWCQLFSEPEAGSDLANLATRAVRDGDEWVVNGQKIWTSFGHEAQFGILIARTDPDVPKHKGISYFICPMDTPGIEVRPIIEMTGAHTFNEVFFTDVRIPAANLVGDVDEGWSLAKVTLGNERVSLSGGGALWGLGPTAADLLDLVRAHGGVDDVHLRHRLAALYEHDEILRLIRLRTVSAAIKGEAPGPEASVRKVLADEHGQDIMVLAKDLCGAEGAAHRRAPAGRRSRALALRLAVLARPSPSVGAPATCSATSSPSACSGCPTTSTSRPGSPGPRPAGPDPSRPTPAARSRADSICRPDLPDPIARTTRSHPMTKRNDEPVFSQHGKVVAAHDLPAIPAGTPGKVLLINGLSWVRYRVLFANGVERGMLSAEALTTPEAWAADQRAAEVEAKRAAAAARKAARPAPATEGSAA